MIILGVVLVVVLDVVVLVVVLGLVGIFWVNVWYVSGDFCECYCWWV